MASSSSLAMPRLLPLAVWSLFNQSHVQLVPAHDVGPITRDLRYSAVSQWLADRGVPVLFAYSPLLLPKPVGWGPNCHVTGPWLPPVAAAPRKGRPPWMPIKGSAALAMPRDWPRSSVAVACGWSMIRSSTQLTRRTVCCMMSRVQAP